MGHVTNGTRSSQTEIPNRNFPKFIVNGKRPGTARSNSRALINTGNTSAFLPQYRSFSKLAIRTGLIDKYMGEGGSEHLGNQWLQNKWTTPSSWLKIDWPTPDRRLKITWPTPTQQNSCFAESSLILSYMHEHVWIFLDLPLLSTI